MDLRSLVDRGRHGGIEPHPQTARTAQSRRLPRPLRRSEQTVSRKALSQALNASTFLQATSALSRP